MEEEEGADEDLDWSEAEAEEVTIKEEDAEPPYNEEAAVQAALDASNLEELGKWPGFGQALRDLAEQVVEMERRQQQEEEEAWRRIDATAPTPAASPFP